MSLPRRAFLAAAAGLGGCTQLAGSPTYDLDHSVEDWPEYDPEWSAPADAPGGVRPEVLVENLEIPWDLAFASTGELFVTERTGRVLRFDAGEVATVAEPADAVDAGSVEPGGDSDSWFVEGGEGGVLGVAVHPAYPDAPYLYVYYTRDGDDSKVNRVARFDVTADDPAATGEPVVDGIPADAVHNGGRVAFGPENYLWVTTGDAGDAALAQDEESLAGKVLRVKPDGRPPIANPDVRGRDRRVYTLGHRNPQGISWLPDGTPVVTEHGPDGRDEISLLEPGANYGWPDARAPGEYAGTDYRRPLVSTPSEGPSWAPAGCVFYTGNDVPSWRNRLVLGALFGQRVHAVTLTPPGEPLPPGRPAPADGGSASHRPDSERYDADWLDGDYVATSHRRLDGALGRVRHVEQGPDGGLYAITSNRDGRARDGFPTERDDVLVRFRPA